MQCGKCVTLLRAKRVSDVNDLIEFLRYTRNSAGAEGKSDLVKSGYFSWSLDSIERVGLW